MIATRHIEDGRHGSGLTKEMKERVAASTGGRRRAGELARGLERPEDAGAFVPHVDELGHVWARIGRRHEEQSIGLEHTAELTVRLGGSRPVLRLAAILRCSFQTSKASATRRLAMRRRWLIVDDNAVVHAAFRKVLGARQKSELDELVTDIFGEAEASKKSTNVVFVMDSAYQGQEALQIIRDARTAGDPYALVFTDNRMPPGWDGVETLEHIFREDPSIQAVLRSAYSEYAWQTISERLPRLAAI